MAKKKIGRPSVQIDRQIFENLCEIHCTMDEIALIFGCTDDTVRAWCKRTYDGQTFSEVYNRLSAGGKACIRRWQFDLASKHDRGMLIWLGKQMLGQRDYQPDANKITEQGAELKREQFEHQKEVDEYKMG